MNSCSNGYCTAGSGCTTVTPPCTSNCPSLFCGQTDVCGDVCYRGIGINSGCRILWDANGDGVVDATDTTSAIDTPLDPHEFDDPFGDPDGEGLGY
jgi:hypothetical protein